tara:strand:+ start:624 stop:917 length:294 start_codon:yes stop_codon:yes gene_type:complete
MRTELAGHCSVDSGQIMVIDPCYAFQGGANYEAICEVSLADTFGEFPLPDNGYIGNVGVVTSSGYGDGYYPVYVQVNGDNRVVALHIVFDATELDYA